MLRAIRPVQQQHRAILGGVTMGRRGVSVKQILCLLSLLSFPVIGPSSPCYFSYRVTFFEKNIPALYDFRVDLARCFNARTKNRPCYAIPSAILQSVLGLQVTEKIAGLGDENLYGRLSVVPFVL